MSEPIVFDETGTRYAMVLRARLPHADWLGTLRAHAERVGGIYAGDMTGRLMVGLGALCTLGVPGIARAQSASSSVALHWEAPAECPSRQTVLETLTELLGQGAHGFVPVSVLAKVERRDAQYLLELSWSADGQEQRRSMLATRCEELARASALLVALAVNPERAHAENPASPAPLESAEKAHATGEAQRSPTASTTTPFVRAPAAKPPASASPKDVRTPARDLAFQSRVGVRFDVGSLPALAPGLGAGAVLHAAGLMANGELSLFSPQTAGSEAARGEFWLVNVVLRPCLERVFGRVALGPCAALGMDALVGRGRSLERNRTNAAFFPRFGLGLEGRLDLVSSLGVFLGVEASVAPLRPSFRLDDGTLVHRPRPWTGRATTGISLKL